MSVFMGLNLMFWNCQGVRSKRKELELYLKENDFDIVALNEMFLTKKINFKIQGYERIKWRIKLNAEKTKVILFSRSYLAGKPEPTLKLYGERLKFYPQVKFLGITFNSKFTFKKHFEDILGCCNARYHCIRLLTNKKWGPSPSTILQIYKQCVRPIFEYGSL